MAEEGDQPVMDTLLAMTAESLERTDLDARSLLLVRLAALIAVDAPSASYLANLAVASDAGLTAEDVQSVAIAVAPIVGSPRVVSAASNIARALGFAIGVAADLAEEQEQP